MWYIVKTDLYKERYSIAELLQLDGIVDIYYPDSRRSEAQEEATLQEAPDVRFRPVIKGVFFVYAQSQAQLLSHLNFRGYFMNDRDERLTGNPHIFSMDAASETLDGMLAHAQVSDEEIYRYKVCIEQCAAHTDDVRIVNEQFADLVAENDLVLITDGPFVGFTGIIRQVKSHGVKDRCFFFHFGNSCVRISGIRRYGVIVVRESAQGNKAQLPNTWRYIDFLLGRLQAAYFADSAAAALRKVLGYYNRARDFDQCLAMMLLEAKERRSQPEGRELALLALWLQQVDDTELAAIKSLRRFFQSSDNSVASSLAELIPDVSLRPFLTPTPGVSLPKGQHLALLPHDRFVELVIRVNLKADFLRAEDYPSLAVADSHGDRFTQDGKLKGKMRKSRPFHLSNKEYVYYAHVGLYDSADGSGVTAMVNWGGFLHRYVQLSPEERDAFLQDLQLKGYDKTRRLLLQADIHDESNEHSCLACHLSGVTVEYLKSLYDKKIHVQNYPPLYPCCASLPTSVVASPPPSSSGSASVSWSGVTSSSATSSSTTSPSRDRAVTPPCFCDIFGRLLN